VYDIEEGGIKGDSPEYIQISIKNPKQKTINNDHFFFCEITITSPFVSVSVSLSLLFWSGKVDLIGPAEIDLGLSLGVASESTIVLVGDNSSGVGFEFEFGNARDGIIGSIARWVELICTSLEGTEEMDGWIVDEECV
jgi:hypothetical protein